jgi:Mg2+/Co2+ transporter CorC
LCGYTIILLLEKILFDVHAHDDNENQENKEICLGDFEIKNLTPIKNIENQGLSLNRV